MCRRENHKSSDAVKEIASTLHTYCAKSRWVAHVRREEIENIISNALLWDLAIEVAPISKCMKNTTWNCDRSIFIRINVLALQRTLHVENLRIVHRIYLLSALSFWSPCAPAGLACTVTTTTGSRFEPTSPYLQEKTPSTQQHSRQTRCPTKNSRSPCLPRHTIRWLTAGLTA